MFCSGCAVKVNLPLRKSGIDRKDFVANVSVFKQELGGIRFEPKITFFSVLAQEEIPSKFYQAVAAGAPIDLASPSCTSQLEGFKLFKILLLNGRKATITYRWIEPSSFLAELGLLTEPHTDS